MPNRHHTFVRDEVLPSWWANAIQAVLSTLAENFRIEKQDATTIRVPAGAGDDLSAIAIDGRWRYVEANVTRAHPGGAAATYDIHVTTAENVIVNAPLPNTDNTNYAFALAITAHNAQPPIVAGSVDYARKVGELTWDGAQITAVRQIVGANDAVRNDDPRLTDARTPTPHASTHLPGGSDPLAVSSPVITAQPVRDVGQAGQMRAGHTLTVAEFTAMGVTLNALFNLSDASNLGGPQNLTNKGGVPFGVGILGAATTCAVFSGSTAQALYITDQGGADGYRLTFGGTLGCWVRTGRRGGQQTIMSKWDAAGPDTTWSLFIDANGFANFSVDTGGIGLATVTVTSTTDVATNRWVHLAATIDGGAIKLYVNGNLEDEAPCGFPAQSNHVPFNIGGQTADGSTATVNPLGGSVDETFVSADIFSEEQIRLTYALKLAHGYPVSPTTATLSVKRRRRGATISGAAGVHFPTAPRRLYNFTSGGTINRNDGSDGFSFDLLNVGTPFGVPGADGLRGTGVYLDGATTYYASDTGLSSGTAARSYGCWFRTIGAGTMVSWGTISTGDARLDVNGGRIRALSAGDIISLPAGLGIDGQWHHVVVVEDNAASDGVKRKLYVDGRMVGVSTVLNAITLGGLTAMRVGSAPDASAKFTGSLDGAFICNYALTPDQVAALYAVPGQQLGASPKGAGDHVEAMDATNVFAIFDSIDPQHVLDLKVAA